MISLGKEESGRMSASITETEDRCRCTGDACGHLPAGHLLGGDKKNITRKPTQTFIKPMSLLIVVIASIFASAAFIDLVLSAFPHLLMNGFVFLHAGILALMLFPIIYYLVFDPLRAHVVYLERLMEALKMSEAEYRSLVESTDDSIYLVNRNCEYLFMNGRHRFRLGFFFSDNYVGRSYGEFHEPDETRRFAEKVDRVFETGKSLQDRHISHRDGSFFLRTLSPIRGANREVATVSVISKSVVGALFMVSDEAIKKDHDNGGCFPD